MPEGYAVAAGSSPVDSVIAARHIWGMTYTTLISQPSAVERRLRASDLAAATAL
jgi:vancomycin permeability regulator SanA